MADLLPVLKQRFFDSNGDPLAGGKLYSYLAGTVTPLGTFTDQSGLVSNTNPVILDADGYADVWVGGGSYKFVLADADDVVLWTVDNVTGPDVAAQTAWTEHAITAGQAATALTGETVNFALYSSAIYDVEIIRGTTIFSNGTLAVQNVNGTGRVVTGLFLANEAHGVTFSVTQASLVATLRAAVNAGSNGTIKLSRRLVPA